MCMVVTKLLCKWFKKEEVYLSDVLDVITSWLSRNDRSIIYAGMIVVMVYDIIKNTFNINWSLSGIKDIIFELLYELAMLVGFIIFSAVAALLILGVVIGIALACATAFDYIHEKSTKVKLVQCPRKKAP
jgi:hypothetical protein